MLYKLIILSKFSKKLQYNSPKMLIPPHVPETQLDSLNLNTIQILTTNLVNENYILVAMSVRANTCYLHEKSGINL